MNFASDNWAGASPRVLAALGREAVGFARAYGHDDTTARLGRRLAALFGREVGIFLTATGTAANSLALAYLCPPQDAVLAHDEAHIAGDEAGAPEFFTQGAKLVTLGGLAGKLTVEGVAAMIERLAGPAGRGPRPAVLSLTQATECGTVYRPDEIAALADLAHRHGLLVHMDGARFANAVASLACEPADITWKAGVDALSFGGTKNGAFMAEAVVFFDPSRAAGQDWRRKRSGHVVSKSRLISAQFLGLLEDGHWLDLARHANAMAARLGAGIAEAGHRIAWPVDANEVFALLPEAVAAKLKADGAEFYAWPGDSLPAGERPEPGMTMLRLVTCFATEPAEVELFLAGLRRG